MAGCFPMSVPCGIGTTSTGWFALGLSSGGWIWPLTRLLVLDWDVLLLSPVAAWTGTVNEGRAKFIDVREVTRPELNLWTKSSNPEFVEFSTKFKNEKGLEPVLHNAYLFAYAVPRRALEDCAPEVLEYAGYCEYRLPTLLQSWGYKLGNLPRPEDWYSMVNVKGRSISRKLIRAQLAQPDGYRMFHPVYEPYQSDDLWLSLADRLAEGHLYRNVSRSFKEALKRNKSLREFFAARLLARAKNLEE